MAYALLAHTGAATTDTITVTTPAIDTTGANLLVVCLHWFNTTAPSLTDSKSNTWTPLTQQGVLINAQIYYCVTPLVGSGHTFAQPGIGGSYPSITVLAFSGAASSPFDQENSASLGSVSSIAPGSVTPSQADELLTAFATCNPSDITAVSDGFTLLDHGPNASAPGNVSYGSAYQVQTTATARNPAFTLAGSDNACAVIATFKAAAGGGSLTNLRRGRAPVLQAVNRAATY